MAKMREWARVHKPEGIAFSGPLFRPALHFCVTNEAAFRALLAHWRAELVAFRALVDYR